MRCCRWVCCSAGFPGQASGAAAEEQPLPALSGAAGSVDSLDLLLEHNTLVIMWPPTQEEWRHEVRPRTDTSFLSNPET
jgi:hypothetical protein